MRTQSLAIHSMAPHVNVVYFIFGEFERFGIGKSKVKWFWIGAVKFNGLRTGARKVFWRAQPPAAVYSTAAEDEQFAQF